MSAAGPLRRLRLNALVTGAALLFAGVVTTAAYAATGELDPTFNTTGKVTLQSPGNDDAWDTVVQPDGKIVVGGSTTANTAAMVWRFNSNGTPDTSFNPMGVTPGQVAIDAGAAEATLSLALAPNGKIVGAGTSGGDSLIYQLNSNGTPDPGFGAGDGHIELDLGAADQLNGVAVDANNNIVATGQSGASTNAIVIRRDTAGNQDNTCDTDGRQEINVGGGEIGNDIEVQANGDILVVGNTNQGPTPGNGFVARLLGSNCSLDAGGFANPNGFAILDSGGAEQAIGVATAPGNKAVVAGLTSIGNDGAVYRRNSDGSPDNSFDTDGAAGIDSGGSEILQDAAVQADNKIVVAGSTSVGPDAAVYRLKANGGPGPLNGALDPTFAGDGAIGVDNGGAPDSAQGLDLAPDGKVVAAGFASGPTGFVFRLEGDPAPVQTPVTPMAAAVQAQKKKCKKGQVLKKVKGKKKKRCVKKKKKKK